jgi:SAM-dependent methyltransferase
MEHQDHVRLLRDGIPGPGGVWADFGSGRGAFTLALADLLGPTAVIYSVDRDRRALRDQEAAMRARFPATTVHYLTADYREPLALPPLDGAVLANTLHFHRDKAPVLARIRGYLRPGGRLLLVEYNTDRGNPWVPYPLSYPSWERLAMEAGLVGTRLLATRLSRFMGEIYAALSEGD